jgi:hypothetical protein
MSRPDTFCIFHFYYKLTFYERCRASLGELRNHFMEAIGNNYIKLNVYTKFYKKINEVGFLLNRMITNVQRARDNYENQRKSKILNSSAKRSLPS